MRGKILLFLTLSGLWSRSSCGAIRKFYYVTEEKNWADAQSYCRNRYDDLASILNMEDVSSLLKNRELLMNRQNGKSFAWIGLSDDMRNWTWSLNSTGHHQSDEVVNKWQASDPKSLQGNMLCTIIGSRGLLRPFSCDLKGHSVCYNGSAYFVQDTLRTWFQARKYCRDEYMDLASVMTETVHAEITKKMTYRSWIGLYRKPWAYWSDQLSVNFTNWNVGELNKTRLEGCAAMNTISGKWVNVYCPRKYRFVCQEKAEHQARLKVRISSGADMNDPKVQRQLLQQVHAMLEKQGMSDSKLGWIQRDGNIFHKEPTKNKN